MMDWAHTIVLGASAHATGRFDPARLSEEELVAQYPVLAAIACALFLVGLTCDIYLLLRFRRARQAATEPLLKVHRQPWGLPELATATALVFSGLLGCGVILAVVAKMFSLGDASTKLLLVGGELLVRLGMVLAFAVYFSLGNIDWKTVLGLQRPTRRRSSALGVICYLAILPPLWLVMATVTQIMRRAGIEQTAQPVAEWLVTSDSWLMVGMLVVFAVVVAPIFEELFFRGFAYPALKERLGAWKALVLVSAVFALIHLHGPSIAPLFALAAALGIAYELTGSLLTPIIMHALFNAMNVGMLLFVRWQL